MQSSDPMPGNPWPHEMVLSIEESPTALHELLWLREAWRLESVAAPEGVDLPPRLAHPPQPVGRPAPEWWSRAWPDLWSSCLAQAARTPDRSFPDRIAASRPGSDERARLLAELRGRTGRDRFGHDAFTVSYETWAEAHRTELSLRRPLTLDDTPERRSLDALIVAWRAGITSFVLIPCRGTFTRRVTPNALLLTEETRNDPRRFSAALLSVA